MSRFTQLALAASALVVSVSASAFASDLPNRKTVPVAPAPVYRPFSWNGVYGGYSTGSFTKDGQTAFSSPSGGALGITGGYNYQMPNNVVVGVEGDLAMANIKGSNGDSSEVRYMNTLRGRAGYAMDRVLPYVTAGYAGASTHDTVGGGSNDAYHNGWTAGAGIEYAFTDNWSAKVEGLYVGLDNQTIPGGGKSGADLGVYRLGLNYRF